jgi:hypothetical protein
VQAGGYRSIEGRLMQIPTDERSLPHTLLGPITTARELASLWAMIWRDEAGPRAACARVRAAAGQQHPQTTRTRIRRRRRHHRREQ